MLPLQDPAWQRLTHAYGAAEDLPALLQRAQADLRPGHEDESAWFDLWSALCHQGDTYSASYAATPHLVAMAHDRRGTDAQFDPLFLVACIELARLEGRGPALPAPIEASYLSALAEARTLTTEALARHWDQDFREGLEAGVAVLSGKAAAARALLDAGLEDEG